MSRQFIYSRVSTDGQTTDGQLVGLTAKFPAAQVVSEVASGAKQRPMLRALLDQLQKGDTLIVAALDRLGRRTSEVLALIEDLERRGVVLVSVREGVDYSSITGRLVTQILVSVAELERAMISERTKAGLAAARKKGKRIGRPSRLDLADVTEMQRLASDGLTTREISFRTGSSQATVSRHLRALKQRKVSGST